MLPLRATVMPFAYVSMLLQGATVMSFYLCKCDASRGYFDAFMHR